MKLLILAAALALAGCAAGPQGGSGAGWQGAMWSKAGANTIVGTTAAPVQCTGSAVHLIPATSTARERYAPMQGRLVEPSFHEAGGNARAQDIAVSTTCDITGAFRFDRVPDGEYFVQTFLAWSEAGNIRGGTMVGNAEVRGGQTRHITLTQ